MALARYGEIGLEVMVQTRKKMYKEPEINMEAEEVIAFLN